MSDSHRDPFSRSEPFVGIGDLHEDLGMFEAATHAAPVELADVQLHVILFAPDGSDQDPTGRIIARTIASAVEAQVIELPEPRASAEMLQAARQQHAADLLVLPVPFGRDFSELGESSLGEVADRVLATCLPFLAVRQTLEESAIREALQNVVVPLSPENPRTCDALAWACRLLNGSGTLTVVEIADADLRAEALHLRDQAELPGASTAARMNRVLTRHFAGPIAAVQRRAAKSRLRVQVETACGQFVESTLAQLKGLPGLVIVAGAADRHSDAYFHEADLILSSSFPVLVV